MWRIQNNTLVAPLNHQYTFILRLYTVTPVFSIVFGDFALLFNWCMIYSVLRKNSNKGVEKMDRSIADINEISHICESIKSGFDVEKLIVFGVKRSERNNTITDVDICVIATDINDKNQWLKKAYLEIDSDIPFDLFLYTSSEWEECLKITKSFASRIDRKGFVFYEKN